MKVLLKCMIAFMLAAILMILAGCIDRFIGEETEHFTGELITPEDIDSIFAAISEDVTEKYPIETDADGQLIVYWFDGGSVWHSSKSCGVIAKSDIDSLNSGDVFAAIASGKERGCKVCSNEYADYTLIDESSETPSQSNCSSEQSKVAETFVRDYDSEGNIIVYWFENGSVWHESYSCPTVITNGQERVHKGSAYEAVENGKKRACKVCSPDSEITVEFQETTADQTHAVTTSITEKYPKEYDSNGELITYWLKSGSVWHESVYCPNIERAGADKVYIGSPYDAIYAGKERACKICSSDSDVVIDIDVTASITYETTIAVDIYPKEYDSNGELIVFWLESGSVWHESLNCSALSNASHDRIISGSVTEAVQSNKERACKRCSQ